LGGLIIQWTFDAPIFGISFGAKHISVHIELPDGYDVVPDGYRQFLRYRQGEQPNVSANDFAELVRDNRPQWLIDIIHSLAPDSASSDEIRNELQRLLNRHQPDGQSFHLIERSRWCRRSKSATENIGMVPAAH
jgi:hypothetical protein